MNKTLIRRIFAIIALIAALCATVFAILCFYNNFSWVFGTVATICICVTAVFGVPVYIMRPKPPTDLGKPPEGEAEDDEAENVADEGTDESDGSSVSEGEAEDGGEDIDADENVVPDEKGDKKRKGE